MDNCVNVVSFSSVGRALAYEARYPGIESHRIFASQGLRSALLIFTLGIARRIFEVTREGLYVMQLVVAATNQNALYKKHMLCRKNVNKIKMRVHIK
jgi:hypothetical protein